jgi:hypothetical protein
MIAKFVRRDASMLAEEAGKMRRVGKRQLLRNVLDRLRGKNEQTFCFGEDALANEMTGSYAGCPFDVIVESINGHAEFLRIKSELVLAAKELVDQRPQLRDGSIGRLQSNRAASRAARGKARHANGNKRQQAAHGHAISLAAKTSLLEQFRAQR